MVPANQFFNGEGASSAPLNPTVQVYTPSSKLIHLSTYHLSLITYHLMQIQILIRTKREMSREGATSAPSDPSAHTLQPTVHPSSYQGVGTKYLNFEDRVKK